MTGRRAARHGARLLGVVLLILDLIPEPSFAQGKGQSSPPQRGPDRTFTLGADGWVLERFGPDLAILRTRVTPASGTAGLLVLSCDGNERRWRLSLPQPMLDPMPANVAPMTTGDIFLRPSGSPGRLNLAISGRAQITELRVLTLAENRSSGDGLVPAFVRLLKAGPDRFDLLTRTAGSALGHRLFGTAVPATVFAPVVRRMDLIAFDDFLATCLATSE
uniref:hypothetical protein n=1 Tax=Methylobacterium sp. TaxID=409 RepID=UPI0020C9A916|nr:hypothetical protein [Methylobacterium sp.]USU34596.1 hypothetical protein NG677_23810 [Methylobacterium sp.]